MIKVCSELPIPVLLKDNLRLNDYDFVLFHLYDTNPVYKEYYKKLRQTHPERLMIFDNSAYEYFVKGEQLDIEKYINAIIDLKPDVYIIPDKLMDMVGTLELNDLFFYTWNKLLQSGDIEMDDWFWNIKSQPMAVVQGNSRKEMTHCLIKYYEDNYSSEIPTLHIAIPFHNSFFADMYDTGNKDEDYAMGRRLWFKENIGLLRMFDHIHLLGSHKPLEKGWYWEGIVKTFDTAYPIKCAYAGYQLGTEKEKPNILIDDILDQEPSPETMALIDENMKIFKDKNYGV